MGLKKYVMVHHGSVRAAGLVVFRCRAQAAAPDTAEWLLLQAVDRQGNTKHGAETVTMCPPQAPALDPAQGPPGAYGGAQDGRTQGDAGGGGAGGGAADRALGHQTGAEVGDADVVSVTMICCRYERWGLVTYWLARLRNYDDPVTLSDEHQGYRCHVMSCNVMSCHDGAGGRGWRRRSAWHQDTRQCSGA